MKSWLVVAILLGTVAYALAEDITLTTYYPSPRGMYKELRSTDATYLATDATSPTAKVGIGTTSPGAALDISAGAATTSRSAVFRTNTGGSNVRVGVEDSVGGNIFTGSTAYAAVFGTSNAFPTQFFTSNAVRMTILSGGNVGIGTTNPQRLLHVNGAAGNTTGVWDNLSDARLKQDVQPLSGALSTVLRLRGVSFQWKEPPAGQEGRHLGLVAQEVEPVLPEWVKTDAEGYRWLRKEGVEALLIEAIKEQQAEIEHLRGQVEDLRPRRP